MGENSRLSAVEQRQEMMSREITALATGIAVMQQSVVTMTESVNKLTSFVERLSDLKIETSHLIKLCERNQKEHEEAFERVRLVERTSAECTQKHIATAERITNNQTATTQQIKLFGESLEKTLKVYEKAYDTRVKTVEKTVSLMWRVPLTALVIAAVGIMVKNAWGL